jgi:hypothetical protein
LPESLSLDVGAFEVDASAMLEHEQKSIYQSELSDMTSRVERSSEEPQLSQVTRVKHPERIGQLTGIPIA